MEQEQNNSGPVSTSATMGMSGATKWIGLVLLLIVVIVAFFLWKADRDGEMSGDMMMEKPTLEVGTPEEVAASEVTTVEVTTALSTQGTSDELGDIEKDLNATDLNALGDPGQL